jgi:hypothetical protein
LEIFLWSEKGGLVSAQGQNIFWWKFDEGFFSEASRWKYWWMLKRHFTTILLPYTIMVVETPFYSWNKCSIFFRLTIYGSKKRFKTIFMVIKKFKKTLNSKTIPFLVRVPFLHQTNRKIFYFLRFFKIFHQIYWYPYYHLPYRKKNEKILLPFITMFFE